MSIMSASPGPLSTCLFLSLSVLAVLVPLLPTASSTGIVNGYCNGVRNLTHLACTIDQLQSHSAIINSLSITAYHLSAAGVVEPCGNHSRGCPFPVDVEQYNARVVREVPGMSVVPLVFDNDGNTVASFRAMWKGGYADSNIELLVNSTVTYNYSGLSMDWEPSCWLQRPSQCSWPTVAESQQYTGFITKLSAAFVAAGRELTVCADHEVCDPYDCEGDDYLKKCAADEWSMAVCNCCAFHTWSVALSSPLTPYSLLPSRERPHPLCTHLCRCSSVVAV